MSVLAPPPSPSPSSCFDAMLSDTDINIDRAMPPTSLKRKASSTKSRAAASIHSSSSDAENRPLIQSSSASTIAKPKRAAKVEVADMAPSKSASTSSPGPAAKKAKLTSSAALVELKNGKLVLKQKPFNWASTMPVLKAVITFQEYLDVHEKLDSIPQDHLHVIAKLAQESDKSLVELAKAIRSKILPEADLGSSESDDSATSGAGAKAKLPLSCIQAAISAVAERRNYGLDAAIAAPHASGSDAADAVAVPAPLQLWRWEATDSAMLPSEFLEKLTQRRNERESARTQAEQLFSSLTEQERQALLSKSTKAKISASITADAQGHVPAGSSASQPIAIDDDNDDGSVADTEHDRKAAQAPSTPVASRKRKPPSSTSTPQSAAKSSAMAGDTSASATSSPREKKKAKETVELSPEKQKEKEEKDAAKAERLKAKEAKRLEREAKELEKQKAKEAKEAEQKKAEELKQRQVNFFTSFVKKAAPKSPSKSVVAAAASSSASGKPAEDVSDFDRTFLPCQYKDLAPINRFASRSGSKPELEMGQDDLSRDEMLSQFLTRASALSGNAGTRARRRKGVHPPASVREIKRVVTESDVLGGNAQEQAEKALETLQDRSKVQMKLLQFESDRRPGWYGTWTKSTNLISPRCPLGQDPVSLDYSYDSDADWEELGQVEGEDVQDGEEEKEDSVGDSDEDSEMDDWLVDDLEVEEEEEQARSAANAMDVDDEIVEVDKLGMPVPAQPVTTNLLHPKKKKKVKLLGRRFDAKLVPFSTGPHWEREFGRCDYDLFSSYRIELLNDACFGLNPFTFTSAEPASSTTEPDEASIVDTPTKPRRGLPAGGVLAALWGDVAVASDAPPAPSASTADKPEAAAPTAFKHQLRPDAIAPLLARIHGSTKTRAGLVDDLKEMLDQLAMPASKNAIGERLTAYATKEKKPNAPWVVKPAFAHLLPS